MPCDRTGERTYSPQFNWKYAAGWCAVFSLAACSGVEEPSPGAGGASVAQGGVGGLPGFTGGAWSAGGSVTAGGAPSAGGAATAAGGQTLVAGGAIGLGGATGSGGASVGSGGTTAIGSGGATTAAGGAAQGGATHKRDHCVDGYAPDPSDDTITSSGPVNFTKNNQTDTIVAQQVIDWMTKNVWQSAHFQWHNIRRCNGGMVITNRDGNLNPCKFTDIVPANQENKGPGDGLEFLAMHRHMIESLKQLFPKHKEMFEGWDKFPSSKADVPEAWQAEWTAFTPANIVTAANKADNPAMYMNEADFKTEGDFGQWIQSKSGLHGALHFKWVRGMNNEHGLGNQFTNIDNYLFWKMHGWIDKVWDKYRAAKNQTPNDKDIKDAVLHQCRHMDDLALLVKPDLNPNPGTCTTPPPTQKGTFVDTIMPIFRGAANKCTGCHGAEGGMGALTLDPGDCGKPSDIVAALVNKPSKAGGQFKLIEPGNPDKSWLYLKVTNKAASAGCTPTNGVQCSTGVMPQGGGGVTLTQAEQDALKAWITAGAPAPQ